MEVEITHKNEIKGNISNYAMQYQDNRKIETPKKNGKFWENRSGK